MLRHLVQRRSLPLAATVRHCLDRRKSAARQFATQEMETGASRMEQAGCAAAAATHLAPVPGTPLIANRSRTRRTVVRKTNSDSLRRLRSRLQPLLRVQLLPASINFLRLKRRVARATRCFTLQKLNPQDYRKIAEWGRGFSMNQVQNGSTDSFCIVDLSARFVLSAPKTVTPCDLSLIRTASGSPADSLMSCVRTNLTTIAFIHTTSRGLRRER